LHIVYWARSETTAREPKYLFPRSDERLAGVTSFEGRASFRAWLYKIATNACFDALDKRPRRALPTTTHPAAMPGEPFIAPRADLIWLEPFPDQLLDERATNPEALYDAHESISLAFLVALEALPPRQRAVLILRDVLDWRAGEVA
jgi:RNA polymerase sigma-70 factor, ECF subfamily